MASGGSKAAGSSRERILDAMSGTQATLGLETEPERWLGRYYQFANRLARMGWLREHGVDAWLLHLLFVDDPHGSTSRAEWREAIAELHAELGLEERHLAHVGVAVLPALERSLFANAA